MLQYFEWRHHANLFLFYNQTPSNYENYIQTIYKDNNKSTSSRIRVSKGIGLASGPVNHSLIKHQTIFFFTLYQRNTFIGLVPVKKVFYRPISFPEGMPEVDPVPSKCCPGEIDNLIFDCFCNSMKTLSLYIRIILPL